MLDALQEKNSASGWGSQNQEANGQKESQAKTEEASQTPDQ